MIGRKFKIGDRVKVRNFTPYYNGTEGYIVLIYNKGGRFDYVVKCDTGREFAFYEFELKKSQSIKREKVMFT